MSEVRIVVGDCRDAFIPGATQGKEAEDDEIQQTITD